MDRTDIKEGDYVKTPEGLFPANGWDRRPTARVLRIQGPVAKVRYGDRTAFCALADLEKKKGFAEDWAD